MYARGRLGILPVIVTTAVNLLVPGIEKLFQSNAPATPFPTVKNELDKWAGQVNLDPTLTTAPARLAWASIRCVAGDPAADADFVAAALADIPSNAAPLYPRIVQQMGCRMINLGTDPAAATTYALAVIRVLTTVQTQSPPSDSLYGGSLPTPLPNIPTPNQQPSAAGIPATYLALGAAALVLLLVMRR